MNCNDTYYRKYQKLVEGKNINPQTLLATDYLNHFNEIHMLLGMVLEMPECLDDILEWKNISYQEHFKSSGFQDKQLAIDAYEYSPKKYKEPFEKCVNQMDELLLKTISNTEMAVKNNEFDNVKTIVSDYSPKMESLIKNCASIISNQETTTQQNKIDDLFD